MKKDQHNVDSTKNNQTHRQSFLSGFVRLLCIVVVLTMIVLSIIGFFPQGIKFGLIMFVGLIILVFILLVLFKKISDSKYMIFWAIILSLGILFRVVYSFTIDADITSDQYHCLSAAQQAANGDFSWTTSDRYFVLWAYQIPFVLYESLILKVFGTIRALYVFNGLFSIVTCILVYCILRKIYQKNIALITTALFSCFPLFIFSIGRLYNQIIAGFFLLLAILFFIDICKLHPVFSSKKIFVKSLLLCGLTGFFLGMSNVFRPEAIIGILAVAVWFIYSFIINVDKKNCWRLLFFVVLEVLATYIAYKLINVAVGEIVIHSGISPNGINNGCFLWSIVCGLTPDSYGGYSTTYIYIVNYDGFQEQFEVFKSIMNDIFRNQGIGEIIEFFVIKEFKMWGELYYCCIVNNVPNIIYILLTNLNHGVYIITMMLSLVGLGKRQFNPIKCFFSILFLGFFVALVIKSIEATYRYSALLVLVLMSAGGIDYLINKKQKIHLGYKTMKRVNEKTKTEGE